MQEQMFVLIHVKEGIPEVTGLFKTEADVNEAAHILRKQPDSNEEYHSYFVHAVVIPNWLRLT